MSFESKVKEIVNDDYSGSIAILEKVIDSIKIYLNVFEACNLSVLKEKLVIIINRFSDFAVLNHFLQYFFYYLDEYSCKDIPEQRLKIKLLKIIELYFEEWRLAVDMAAEKMERFVEFKNKRVLLHSNSKSIYVLFEHLAVHKTLPIVYQTTAAPIFEGKLQADYLLKLGCKVNFINETALSRFIDEIDFAVMGADNVFDDGFTNKIGTLNIAKLCKEKHKNFYVFCDSRKFSPVSFINKVGGRNVADNNLNRQTEFTENFYINEYFFEDRRIVVDHT